MKSIEIKDNETFHDKADMVKHVTKIHANGADLSEDFVLFQGTEEQKEFMRKQMTIANRITDYIADKKVGYETAQMIIRECENIAILERNKPQNWLVEHIVKQDTVEPVEEQEGKIDHALSKIFGDKSKET